MDITFAIEHYEKELLRLEELYKKAQMDYMKFKENKYFIRLMNKRLNKTRELLTRQLNILTLCRTAGHYVRSLQIPVKWFYTSSKPDLVMQRKIMVFILALEYKLTNEEAGCLVRIPPNSTSDYLNEAINNINHSQKPEWIKIYISMKEFFQNKISNSKKSN